MSFHKNFSTLPSQNLMPKIKSYNPSSFIFCAKKPYVPACKVTADVLRCPGIYGQKRSCGHSSLGSLAIVYRSVFESETP